MLSIWKVLFRWNPVMNLEDFCALFCFWMYVCVCVGVSASVCVSPCKPLLPGSLPIQFIIWKCCFRWEKETKKIIENSESGQPSRKSNRNLQNNEVITGRVPVYAQPYFLHDFPLRIFPHELVNSAMLHVSSLPRFVLQLEKNPYWCRISLQKVNEVFTVYSSLPLLQSLCRFNIETLLEREMNVTVNLARLNG